MMELNKNSRYNKWYLNFNSKLPNNFCDYFWGSVKSLFASIFYLIAVLFIISSLFTPILLFWNDLEKNSELLQFSQMLGLSIYILGIILLIIHGFAKCLESKPYNNKPKKDSVIKTWYKNFKNRHCTMIIWKD